MHISHLHRLYYCLEMPDCAWTHINEGKPNKTTLSTKVWDLFFWRTFTLFQQQKSPNLSVFWVCESSWWERRDWAWDA